MLRTASTATMVGLNNPTTIDSCSLVYTAKPLPTSLRYVVNKMCYLLLGLPDLLTLEVFVLTCAVRDGTLVEYVGNKRGPTLFCRHARADDGSGEAPVEHLPPVTNYRWADAKLQPTVRDDSTSFQCASCICPSQFSKRQRRHWSQPAGRDGAWIMESAKIFH